MLKVAGFAWFLSLPIFSPLCLISVRKSLPLYSSYLFSRDLFSISSLLLLLSSSLFRFVSSQKEREKRKRKPHIPLILKIPKKIARFVFIFSSLELFYASKLPDLITSVTLLSSGRLFTRSILLHFTLPSDFFPSFAVRFFLSFPKILPPSICSHHVPVFS